MHLKEVSIVGGGVCFLRTLLEVAVRFVLYQETMNTMHISHTLLLIVNGAATMPIQLVE